MEIHLIFTGPLELLELLVSPEGGVIEHLTYISFVAELCTNFVSSSDLEPDERVRSAETELFSSTFVFFPVDGSL